MRYVLAALFVLGCSPVAAGGDASADAPLGDVETEACECFATCVDGIAEGNCARVEGSYCPSDCFPWFLECTSDVECIRVVD